MITFNGKNLRDYGVTADESQARTKPNRDVEVISIAGRNGDLTISNNRFENVTIPFDCIIRHDFVRRYDAMMAFLRAEDGYQRLEISSEADFYRMARLSDPDAPDPGQWSRSGTFTLEFDCKPQRWYKSGERVKENPEKLINPSRFEALPLIRCYGSGVLKVGAETIEIAKHSYEYIDIDCELQDCYCGASNCNDLVALSTGDFPTLPAGTTGFSFTGTKFEVTPRWWTI